MSDVPAKNRKVAHAAASRPASACPTASLHTPCPDGYAEWHEWADARATTHKQEMCPGCRRYAIWTPKEDTRV